MNQLNCLPQNAVVWGHDALTSAASVLDIYGIARAMTFTVEPLRKLHEMQLAPHVAQGVGCFTDLPPHVPDTSVRAALSG